MDNIIITVKDEQGSFFYDMEIPSTVPMKPVIEQLIGNLSLLNPAYPFYRKKWVFICSRTNQKIAYDNTAQECGIWNGDYLIMKEEQHGADHL